jgi:hypothetical protein
MSTMTRNFGENLQGDHSIQGWNRAFGGRGWTVKRPQAHMRLGLVIEAFLQRGVLATSILTWSLGLILSILEALYHPTSDTSSCLTHSIASACHIKAAILHINATIVSYSKILH